MSEWWRSAVIYQVYIRSFRDGDGDGVGDIAGIRERLPYLRDLGVDALWINPWYPSPMADAGYDVADYRDIEPTFGTLDDAGTFIAEAHAHGLRILLDIVPNHTSDQHPWFQEALRAAPGTPARDRYMFRPGRGDAGELPPNDWQSMFGGPAWTRAAGEDGAPGEWYLHLFAPEQPDLDWRNDDVRAEFESVLRFWFDLGVDGFRIDVAHGMAKDPALPDLGLDDEQLLAPADRPDHPHWDRDEVHEIYRGWRAIADSYEDPRVFVAEAWVDDPDRLGRYVRPDELHTAFNFDFLRAPWRAEWMRRAIDVSIASVASVGAPPTWVLSNHDVVRHVSRYGRPQPEHPQHSLVDVAKCGPVDLDLGVRRARAAALLMLALPGGAYVYQGEELGLREVEDIPEELLQDPVWQRSGHTERGRDGCRVPVPWAEQGAAYGFSPADATAGPWLPQPGDWGHGAADRQTGSSESMLELYRTALGIRREHAALGDGTMHWVEGSPSGVLAFGRDPGFRCMVNFGSEPVPLPQDATVLVASDPTARGGALGPDAAVWLEVAPDA